MFCFIYIILPAIRWIILYKQLAGWSNFKIIAVLFNMAKQEKIKHKIGFIGGGNMAKAIAQSIVHKGKGITVMLAISIFDWFKLIISMYTCIEY